MVPHHFVPHLFTLLLRQFGSFCHGTTGCEMAEIREGKHIEDICMGWNGKGNLCWFLSWKKTNENKLNWLTTTIHKFWQIGCSRLKFEKRFFGYSTYLCLQYICDFENLAPLPAVLSVASKVPNDSNWRSKFKRCGDFLASPKGKPISKTNKIHQCFICKYI